MVRGACSIDPTRNPVRSVRDDEMEQPHLRLIDYRPASYDLTPRGFLRSLEEEEYVFHAKQQVVERFISRP